jgi:hypothetical protein
MCSPYQFHFETQANRSNDKDPASEKKSGFVVSKERERNNFPILVASLTNPKRERGQTLRETPDESRCEVFALAL